MWNIRTLLVEITYGDLVVWLSKQFFKNHFFCTTLLGLHFLICKMNGAGKVCVKDYAIHALRGADKRIIKPSVLYSNKFAPDQREASFVASISIMVYMDKTRYCNEWCYCAFLPFNHNVSPVLFPSMPSSFSPGCSSIAVQLNGYLIFWPPSPLSVIKASILPPSSLILAAVLPITCSLFQLYFQCSLITLLCVHPHLHLHCL